MKQGIERLRFEVKEPRQYLLAELRDEVEPIDFCIEMATRNDIAGLLPLYRQFADGQTQLWFDITGQRRLSSVLQGERGQSKAVLMLLQNLVRALQGLNEYFLHVGQCLLDRDYIFVDDHMRVSLALVPLEGDEGDSSGELRRMFMDILGDCAADARMQATFAPLLAYLMRTEFRLSEFAEQVKKLAEGSAPAQKAVRREEQPIIPKPTPRPAPAPTPVREEKPAAPAPAEEKKKFSIPSFGGKKSSVEEPAAPGGVNIPGGVSIPGAGGVNIPGGARGGMSIPGGGSIPAPVEKPNKKQEKPKEEHKKFSLFGGKKEKEQKLALDEESYVVSGGVPVAEPHRPVSAPPVQQPRPVGGDAQWHGTVSFENTNGAGGKTEYIGADAVRENVLRGDGHTIRLTAFPFTVGRENCDYIINSIKISRHHITLMQQDGVVYVRDENSSNHTYLNGSMLAAYTPYPLQNGDELRLGNLRLIAEVGA